MGIEEDLDRIEEALDGEDPDLALSLARKAVRSWKDSPDAWGLLGEALEQTGDLEGAIDAYEKATGIDPDWASGHAHLAGLLLELGDAEAAGERIDRALGMDRDEPEATYNLAKLSELDGDVTKAEGLSRTAARLDRERFHAPVRVPLDAFRRMAVEAMEDLPERVRSFLGDMPVLVEDLPGPDSPGPLILGECIGDHRSEAGALDPVTLTPARILLYKRNLERISKDRSELEEEIRTTVLHEILHWLGLDESEVEDRGLR